MRRIAPLLVLLLALSPGCGSEPDDDPLPEGPSCSEQHRLDWEIAAAPSCAGGRTCLDDRGRWWLLGEPFIPRGLYNAGFEYDRLFDNCPAGADCEDTNPADVHAYLEQMAGGGFNLVQERSLFVADLRAAVHANPHIYFAHLLWSDPFTEEGREALVAEIEEAAEDPDVVMWFGPDEVDMWDDWPTAAGIRRLLRGSSPELDAALAGAWSPGEGAVLPVDEPAHDPYELPYGAALDATWALSPAASLYEALMPTIYPLTGEDSAVDGSYWGTARVSTAGGLGATALPVLQMVGIGVMGLSQPTPDQIRALIGSSMAHGARGAFYYTYISDGPGTSGRDGWYAPDDTEAFAAYTEMHEIQDSLLPVLFSDAAESAETAGGLEWRRWELGGRSVAVVVNARAEGDEVELDEVLPGVDQLRDYQSCEAVEASSLELGPYEVVVLEGW